MTTFKANRKFPNPITVTDDPKSHTLALQQIIEALNIGQRRTKEVNSSYVRVHELVDVGLVEIVGNQLKLTNTGAAAVASTPGASALADLTDVDLTGLADGDTLVWNSGTGMWEPGAGGGGLTDLYDQTLNNLADVGFSGQQNRDVLTYDATTGLWTAANDLPDSVAEFLDDFLYHAVSSYYQNGDTWRSLASSSNSHAQIAAVSGHPGIVRATNANTADGAYTIYCLTNDQNSGTWNDWYVNGSNELVFETVVRLSALPSSANNVSSRYGLQNINNATHYLNFFLQWSGSQVEWYIANAAGGTAASTTTTSGVPTVNTWFKLKIVATSTSVKYYIDDVLIVTHTTYIPTAALTAYFTTVRSAIGNATVTLDIDYCLIRQTFASGRPA